MALAMAAMMLGLGGCAVQDGAYRKDVDAWHAQRIERLKSDTGWLTLVGLHKLGQGAHTVGSASGSDISIEGAPAPRIGTLEVVGNSVTFVADRLATVEHDGQRILREQMTTDAEGAPTVLVAGGVRFYVIDRGGDLYLRVKDEHATTLTTFKGIDRYPVEDRWRVQARLLPGTASKIGVPNVLGQVEASDSPGVLAFELAGQACQLAPTLNSDGSLFFVFGDPTNGAGTYPAGRFLDADAISDDGTVMLDFNRATNPMCAFTAYATCPLPPDGNTLAIPVEAGEKYPLPH
ncbi:MAG: DUF1684 domain-containing protein [Phycisphaerales bacterium]|nr:DUF1684 domain-containing protein [Phycisphaerales bacterium]